MSSILKPVLGSQLNLGHPLANGLVGLWLMNEGSGPIVFDLSGNGRNGVAIGAINEITWQSGPNGSVVDFVGDTLAGFSFNTITLQSTIPWTLIFKAQSDGDANEAMILGEYGTTNNFIRLREGLDLRFYGSATSKSFTSVTSFTSWATYALVAEGDGNLHLYVDGIFKETQVTTTSLVIDNIGAAYSTNAYAYDGRVSHVSIYNNRALSASEVALLRREPFCTFERMPIELFSAATQGVAGDILLLSAAVSAAASVSGGLIRSVQLASILRAEWVGINSSHYDSHCGDDGYRTVEEALDGTDSWRHTVEETHYVILDLGVPTLITKVRGRSKANSVPDGDPSDVNIYISNDKEDWGAAVATGISTWQATDEWVEEGVTDKEGRYVKVEIVNTAGLDKAMVFGGYVGTPFTIFDVYGVTVGANVVGQSDVSSAILLLQQLSGDASGEADASGGLSLLAHILLAALVAPTASVSSSLFKLLQLSGAVEGDASVSSSLLTLLQLAAAVSGQAVVAGSLAIKDKILLAAVVLASASISGGMLKLSQFAGASSAVCSTSADFTVDTLIELAAAISASCSNEAALDISKLLSAAASGTVTTDAALKTLIQIAADVATQSSTSASFDMLKNMAAIIIAEADVEAAIHILQSLAAAITASSTFSGKLLIAGVAAGVDEGVRTDFQFPHIPESLPEDVKRVLTELRIVLEQQLSGDFRVGGAMDVDGDIHTRGILRI